jgi:serine/threonine-protein kinase HipA
LLKFDGVSGNRDKELADPQGFGRIEYAYHRMALAAGIQMEPCRLHEEGGRAHFMTRRFDRTTSGGKLHMQSFGALAHHDFGLAGAYAYEQVLQTMRTLALPMHDVEQQVRRTFFNILARNQDDHVKNIAFLMDRAGVWRLSPAFDVSYSWNPTGAWTSVHQMTLGGKRDGFTGEDLVSFAAVAGIKKTKAVRVLAEVSAAVSAWQTYAREAAIDESDVERITRAHRNELFVH